MEAEKRDIDISKLFAWRGELELKDDNLTPIGKVYVRLAGDADINRARVFGLRESAKLRKALHDPNSDESLALLVDKDIIEPDNLLIVTASLKLNEITKEVIEEFDLPLPVEPKSDAPLEMQERYQKEVDEYPIKRQAKISELITKKLEENKKFLESLTLNELYDYYLKLAVNYLCEIRLFEKYKEMCVYLGTYKDAEFKERLFESFDDFSNSLSSVKIQLLNFYNTLEIDMTNLKKS